MEDVDVEEKDPTGNAYAVKHDHVTMYSSKYDDGPPSLLDLDH